MKKELESFKNKLENIQKSISDLKSEAENIRSYYKYQNEETRSISEDFIVSYSNCSDIECIIDSIDSLIEYEEEQECDCDEE